jgi:hypothetical protein
MLVLAFSCHKIKRKIVELPGWIPEGKHLPCYIISLCLPLKNMVFDSYYNKGYFIGLTNIGKICIEKMKSWTYFVYR